MFTLPDLARYSGEPKRARESDNRDRDNAHTGPFEGKTRPCQHAHEALTVNKNRQGPDGMRQVPDGRTYSQKDVQQEQARP